MKKTLIALAAMTVIAGAAQAQSTVTLYGRLDAGLAQQTKETTGAAPVASLSQNLGTTSTLRTTYWGLKGSEDLGGGLRANFDLQSQFDIDTGSASKDNTLFERQATVGLSGSFGTVNLGRQYPTQYAVMQATDLLGNANVSTATTVWGSGLKQSVTRVSNSIRYDSPSFGGVSGSAVYGLGENKQVGTLVAPAVTNFGDATNVIGVSIKYAAGPLMVTYGHQEEKQAQATAIATQLTNKYDVFGGTYDFGVAMLNGSYQKSTNGTTDDKEYQVGVAVPFGAAAIAVGYTHSNSATPGALELNSKGFTLAGTYTLSKRTSLYAGYVAQEIESGAAISTAKTTTFATGVVHTF